MLRSSPLKSKTFKLLIKHSFNYFLSRTDFIWAKAMGYTGQQLEDSAGVSVGESLKNDFNNLLGIKQAPLGHGFDSNAP